MEENTNQPAANAAAANNTSAPQAPAAGTDATPQASSPAPSTATNATKTGGNNTPLLIGIGIVVVAVIAAIVIGIILVMQNGGLGGSNGNDVTALNPGNPEQALGLINSKIEEVVLASASGDPEQITSALSEFAEVDSGEFTLTFRGEDSTMDLDLTFEGRFSGGDNPEDVAFEGTLMVSGTIPDLGPILDPITIDMVIVDEVMYLNMENLPAEFGELLSLLGLSEGQWYSLPLDTQTTEAAEALTGGTLSTDDLADLEKEIQENPIFTNARAADDRTIEGVTAKCMLVSVNDDDAEVGSPVEICSPENDFLPFFVGVTSTVDGVDAEISFVMNTLGNDVNIQAPAGAQDLEALLNALSGGF